jgi:murein L,D-transpeptidase YafK
MNLLISQFLIFFVTLSFSNAAIDITAPLKNKKVDAIVMKKKNRKMELYTKEGILIKMYSISLGFNPLGHKEKEGDGKTPEGKYDIQGKNPHSRFHRSLRISYPNKVDLKNAKKKGVSAGGDIMIHGLGKEFAYLGTLHTLHNWTLGCVAVINSEIDEIYTLVDVGTKVTIEP